MVLENGETWGDWSGSQRFSVGRGNDFAGNFRVGLDSGGWLGL